MQPRLLLPSAPALLCHALLLGSGASESSTLLSGGTIIAFDEASESLRVIRNGSLLVTGGAVAGLFSGAPPPGRIPGGTETVDVTGKIISPGFVDTHKHGWQTAFKTVGSNTTLAEYVLRYSEYATPALVRPTADDIYLGQLFGIYEALNSGTTTVLDHAHHTWSDATAEAGLRASIDSAARIFWAYAFHNVTDFVTVEEQLSHFRKLATEAPFKNTPTSLAIAYDAIGQIPPNRKELDAVMSLATYESPPRSRWCF